MTRWNEDSKAKQRDRENKKKKSWETMPTWKDYEKLTGKFIGSSCDSFHRKLFRKKK